ncbi:MAG: CTP synthase (glutamine hydrolyzing) [Candidatus Thermoplasmatota archaeon]|nr:CTP synthase (glutamine hydrolyzing) [Candidatus Thermoplasmatota archaeon]
MKYVIVTGGVLSGLGKGITTSSIGLNLKARGLKVTAIKIDPYLNCDAGTMNPFQHGEVFVLEDGGEVDLDLGNYERFLDVELTIDHNITTGKAYLAVIEKERHGDYLGGTVQIIPHVTDEIKRMITSVAESANVDVTLVEIGGTVGDIESMPFLEAVRQLSIEVGKENCFFVHTTLVPILPVVGEPKTKPTQHSVKELRAVGIQPDAIVARAPLPLGKEVRQKISLFCDVPLEGIVSAPDAGSIYEVPLILNRQGLTDYLMHRMALKGGEADMKEWKSFVDRITSSRDLVEIALVGKYTHLQDSYMSHVEAFKHAGARANVKVKVRWIESVDIEKRGVDILEGVHGILVPGGFGDRGIEGKVMAIQYAREGEIPFQGVCLGFQLATVEFARHVLGLEGANSTEFDPKTPYPVVDLLPEQRGVEDMGATMRLGAHEVVLKPDSKARDLYGSGRVYERHRHRYEVNPAFIPKLEAAGLLYPGMSADGRRMDVLELDGHPYFIASQFHPEFKSRPLSPSPIHYGLVSAALKFRG